MAKGSALRNVLAALDRHGSKTKSHGGYYTTQCPAHDDRTASLSFGQGEKGAKLKCHAECTVDDIRIALDLSWPDLFDNGGQMQDGERPLAEDLWMPCQGLKDTPPEKRCPGHKVAEYRYTDEQGNLIYAVARCSMKGKGCQGFSQWMPDHTKKFGKRWSVPGTVRKVLYDLPRVLAAAKAGKRIWFLEGEKDVERMKADFPGEVATTMAAGAGKSKWRQEYGRYLYGASELIVVADCDKTGLEHAQEVHTHTSAVVPVVKVVCSPVTKDGADFSDHRDFGFGLDEFERVPFEPIKKRPRMAILVEEEHREKPVVFNGYAQDRVERSLVGAMLRYGYSYKINPVDLVADTRLQIIVKATARIGARGGVITPETVAVEVEDMGVSTYANVLAFAIELEGVAFDDTEKPAVAARLLRERTMRRGLTHVSRATESALQDEGRELEQILSESLRVAERAREEYETLLADYCEPVGDVFTASVDVIEEVLLEETEPARTNVRELRPAAKQDRAVAGQRG